KNYLAGRLKPVIPSEPCSLISSSMFCQFHLLLTICYVLCHSGKVDFFLVHKNPSDRRRGPLKDSSFLPSHNLPVHSQTLCKQPPDLLRSPGLRASKHTDPLLPGS
ncbi:hypothetical protein GOODEAATRI_027817, partial [Goodea atripinnis]